jgi:hypothetical protein
MPGKSLASVVSSATPISDHHEDVEPVVEALAHHTVPDLFGRAGHGRHVTTLDQRLDLVGGQP